MELATLEVVLGFAGVIYTATIGALISYVLKKQNKVEERFKEHKEEVGQLGDNLRKTQQAIERQEFRNLVINPKFPIKEWTKFATGIHKLCKDTEVDRFLLLVALNGINRPTHASVIWEWRTVGEIFSYNDVPLDDDYVDRLHRTQREGLFSFKTKDVLGTEIGNFYSKEGVVESIWGMVSKRHNYETGQVAYKYFSIATHDENGFSNIEDIKRQVYVLLAELRKASYETGFVLL